MGPKTHEGVEARAAVLRRHSTVTLRALAREAAVTGWVGAKRDALAQMIAEHEAGITQPATVPPPAPAASLLARMLRLVREAHGLTQTQLAERVGHSPQAVNQYESGWPKEQSLAACAAAMGLSFEGFLRKGLDLLKKSSEGSCEV